MYVNLSKILEAVGQYFTKPLLKPGLRFRLCNFGSILVLRLFFANRIPFSFYNHIKTLIWPVYAQARKMQERGWKPRWFTKEEGSEAYRYKGGYWEARESGSWEDCPDIFGHIDSEQQTE